MSKNIEYTIVVRRERIAVSYDVYKAYHKEREHARYVECEARKHEISKEWLEDNGVNPKYAGFSPSPLDIVIYREELTRLNEALHSLPEKDQSLIRSLFFERKSERQIAEKLGCTQQMVSYNKRRILKKLKKVIEI